MSNKSALVAGSKCSTPIHRACLRVKQHDTSHCTRPLYVLIKDSSDVCLDSFFPLECSQS
uniref:Uncharacterized protein n=1 Tax=Anguilla anguilla TaxID=7936 RepID=A0A0E9X5J6_ANGAN